ncbi:tetratricopeptide repeat protein [Limnobacter sp.]|uniref:tetratricopeptide repeat protein n=1 Tax=Limnobacter sp. TaxID=2003368 RepID=UPI00258B0E4A|nr:tetratricopeptide repeat protein [Limnobacter sp.]
MNFSSNRSAALLGLAITVALSGCASTQGKKPESAQPPAGQSSAKKPVTQGEYKAQIQSMVAKDPMFALLAAELAAQRGDNYSAVIAYTEAAKALKRADLAKRAVELSLNDNDPELSLSAAQTWYTLAPTDPQAKRSVLLLQLSTNRVDEAMPALKDYVADLRKLEEQHPGISGVTPDKVTLELLLRIPDKDKAYNTGLKLLGDDPTNDNNQNLLSQLAYSTDHYPQAVAHIEQAIKVKPAENYYVLLAQYLEKRDGNSNAAIALLTAQTAQHPKWFAARLYLARTYTQAADWPNAKTVFDQLIQMQPDNYALYSSQGFVLSKLHDRRGAEKYFQTYLKKMPADQIQNEPLIYLTLSGLALDDKDYKGALRWIDKAPDAAENIDLQLRKSLILEESGKMPQAMKVLNDYQAQDDDEGVRIILARSQLAEKQKQPKTSEAILDKGLSTYPDQPDLLYERSMVAERQDDLVAVEKYLRRLIAVKPDSANGYNALGYTFADHGIRLDEALELIQKANSLSPNDPFILDSLGWVYFKLGRNAEAEETLKKALSIRSDQEIGTHLVQVLLKSGKKAEAQQLADKLKTQFPAKPSL